MKFLEHTYTQRHMPILPKRTKLIFTVQLEWGTKLFNHITTWLFFQVQCTIGPQALLKLGAVYTLLMLLLNKLVATSLIWFQQSWALNLTLWFLDYSKALIFKSGKIAVWL